MSKSEGQLATVCLRVAVAVLALAVSGCGQSRRPPSDAGTPGDGGPVSDAGDRDGGVGMACALDVSALGPDSRPTPAGYRLDAIEPDTLVLSRATGETFRWVLGGLSTDGLSVGASARLGFDVGGWRVLRFDDGPAFDALVEHGFVAPSLRFVPPDGAEPVTLELACQSPDPTPACGGPVGNVETYDLRLADGSRVRPGEVASVPAGAVAFGGARQLPSNVTMDCVLEADWAASLAFRLERSRCDALEDAYATALEDHAACDVDDECVVLNGQCGVGLGGCYVAANRGLTQARLDDLGQAYANAGCTGAVCDCAEPPSAAACAGGECAFPLP